MRGAASGERHRSKRGASFIARAVPFGRSTRIFAAVSAFFRRRTQHRERVLLLLQVLHGLVLERAACLVFFRDRFFFQTKRC